MSELDKSNAEAARYTPEFLNRELYGVVGIVKNSQWMNGDKAYSHTSYLKDEESIAYIAGYFEHNGYYDYALCGRSAPKGIPITAAMKNGVITVVIGRRNYEETVDIGMNDEGLPYAVAVWSDETASALMPPVDN